MNSEPAGKGGSIYLADGGLHRGGEAPPLSVSAHVAQMAEMDRRNKILKAHADKCETAAKHFAGKLDQIAKARQVLANEDSELEAAFAPADPLAIFQALTEFRTFYHKFLDAIDAALEKSFIPEPPAK